MTTTVAPATAAPAPDDDDDATTPAPRPQSQCCWSTWGNHYECANYPSGGHGGFCNNDVTKNCEAGGNSDCSDLAPPVTTPPPPPPTTQPWTPPPTTTMPEGACVKTQSTGCLNGESYVFADHFICGKGGNIGIHMWGQSACCGLGLVYDPHSQFCCNNGLNQNNEGQCHEFDPQDDPVGCRCTSSSPPVPEAVATADDSVIIDTQDWRYPAENPCMFNDPTGVVGCLNGYTFDPLVDTLCGQYIVKGDTHGCCPTNQGIKTYNLQTESCCQFGSDGDVRPGGMGAHSACQCREWPNAHCSGSLFSTVV